MLDFIVDFVIKLFAMVAAITGIAICCAVLYAIGKRVL